MLTKPYLCFVSDISKFLPKERIITNYAKRFAYGVDASFYRLTPQVVLLIDTEAELISTMRLARGANISITFRAAGTSLSGQAQSDSILIMLTNKWRHHEILDSVKIKPGCENNDLVQNLDFAQTFLDIAGVKAPDDMQGKSLVPLMNAEAGNAMSSTAFRDAIYYHFYENPGWAFVPRHYGVRTDRYKLIHFYQLGTWEFYDLASDPDELNNLIEDKSQLNNISQLKKRLAELRQEYQVPEEDPEPTFIERLKFWLAHKGLSSQLEP